MAYYIEDEIYYELTGDHQQNFTSLYVTDPRLLRAWTRQYNYPYRGYPLYSGYQ